MSLRNDDRRYPDFIIAGAMKCGTTSLHFMLDQHEQVYIPDPELFFFDIDDFAVHTDFFVEHKGSWFRNAFSIEDESLLEWYADFFRPAKPDDLIGEDSTTYLASAVAPQRILQALPDAKIIIMLRDPASRAYSQYWHLVRTGRARYTFKESLRIDQGSLLSRGSYTQQVERFLSVFPREQLHFLLFEDFIGDMQASLNNVCVFLGLEASLDVAAMETHYNKTYVPKYLRLQLLRNYIMSKSAGSFYQRRLPNMPKDDLQKSFWERAFDSLHCRLNKMEPKKPEPMDSETRRFLDEYFMRENKGLGELIGKDVDAKWYRGISA